jgi:hypothetical protein
MIKLIKYIIILLLLICLSLAIIPLNLYYDYLKNEIKPTQLENISGSIIKGSSEKLSYLGANLGRAKWLIYPNSWNSLAVDLQIEDAQYNFSSQIVTKANRTSFNKVKGTLDWDLVGQYINFNRGEVSGYLKLDMQEISISSGVPDRIIGKAVTKELKLKKPIEKELGEIWIDFSSENPNFIVGLVSSDSKVINVSGAVYIHKNHRWEVKLNILPLPGEYELEYALQGIGDKRAGGGRTLNLAGFY